MEADEARQSALYRQTMKREREKGRKSMRVLRGNREHSVVIASWSLYGN